MNRDVTIGQKPASILIVDDVAANLQVLTGMLDNQGYLTRPVTSGKMALLAAQNDPRDLVLLDIIMPGMDGYEVCARMKANEKLKDIPVIFISALHIQTLANGVSDLDALYSHVRKIGGREVLEDDFSILDVSFT